MLAPLLIMLREGLEAALVVAIIATYLKRTGRGAWIKTIWVGVLFAVALSLFVGAGLQAMQAGFPQRAQEAFEAVVAFIAVGVLVWMVFWMRAAARSIRDTLESGVEAAFARAGPGQGTVWALIAMSFFAVAREGLESVFFLLAIFQQAPGPEAPLAALAGIVLSIALGWGIYAGGLRLNLRLFFRVSGLFILFVAAGLFSGGLRSLHEAGLWNLALTPAWDLSQVLPMSSVLGSILAALFGYHETPGLGEVLAWAVFLALTLPFFLRPAPVAQPQEA
ncbi:high-affinity iron transporter [Rhodobacter sp. JA431]|uniref:iron uptake transporter permease EfeU n=1 Tax=Rhodobacter sp. JA431 TaxID=570013 RepID=UPI000BC612F4|nr:iron uptake transporter permease EfeU [Rhodobacter sp. JA431]SOB89780.1 high-affinity iron transporter [Rhodobacter sp. JA431]